MSVIAGQTAGPIGLTFIKETNGYPGHKFFYRIFFFFKIPRATPGNSANMYLCVYLLAIAGQTA